MIRSLKSPPMVVALVALVAALGGTAWALTNGSVKSKHIARNAVKDKHLKNQDTIKLRKLSPSATNADQNAARAEARRVTLHRSGPFRIYAKCYRSTNNPANPGMHLSVYLQTSPGAVFDSSGSDTSNSVLQAGEPETQRELAGVASFAGVGDPGTINISDHDDSPFYAAQGGGFIEGSLFVATKVGNPEDGSGVFGSGNKCMLGGTVRSG